MPLQHTNRRGDVYFVQAKERAGKIAYSATKKPTGNLIDAIPNGYEIYEHPDNVQVFVRKIKPTKILPSERELVEASIRKFTHLKHFIVDVEADCLVVYVTDSEPDAALNFMRTLAPMAKVHVESAQNYILSRARYSRMMRFVLIDETSRTFSVERWCFLGSIDNWYYLNGGKPLDQLVKEYVPHLGKESFFELG